MTGAKPSMLDDTFCLPGSTDDDQINPPSKTIIDINKPLEIKSLLSSQPPPMIVNINIALDINAERMQKKQYACILKTIMPIRTKLKIAMQFESINKNIVI